MLPFRLGPFGLFAHLLFWGWGLFACLVAWFGLGPEILHGLVVGAWAGVVPRSYAMVSALLWLGPALGLGMGLLLRRDPGRLASLFFGIEVPVLLVALLRLFAFQELNPAVQWLAWSFGLGALGLTYVVCRGPSGAGRWGRLVLLGTQTAFLVPAVWLGGVVALIALPINLQVWSEVFSSGYSLRSLPLTGLILASSLVLFVLPAAMVAIGSQAWRLSAAAVRETLGTRVMLGTASVVLVGVAGGVVGSARATSDDVWAKTLDPRQALQDEDRVREALVDAYLWEVRYLGADDVAEKVGDLWSRSIGGGAAMTVVARVWLDPILFDGMGNDDSRRWAWSAEAGDRYRAVFDEPVERAETERIQAAMAQSWMWWEAEARILDVGAEHVWLERQEVTVEERDGAGVVTVHDVYRNQTYQDREVVLYFSLPEQAVVTGLWLGDSPDRSEAFTHVVAPRGAAQQVYQEQTRRRMDPALLEQVGPRQYRLRAFPILPRTGEPSDVASIGTLGPAFHLWLELTELPERDAAGEWRWPVPMAAETRGLVWNDDTERLVAGESADPVDAWVTPPSAVKSTVASLQSTVGDDSGESGWTVRFDPLFQDVGVAVPPDNLVVLVDTTASMRHLKNDLQEAVSSFPGARFYCADVDGLARCPDAPVADWAFAGASPLPLQIFQATGIPDVAAADALLVLTDASTYDSTFDRLWSADEVSALLPPLTLVHLDGLPLAYSDQVLDLLSLGGRSFSSIHDARRHLAGLPVGGWTTGVSAATSPVDSKEGPLQSVAAAAVVASETRSATDLESVSTLDRLHRLAVLHDIVTPVSSMIVLVDRAQRERLAALEQQEDRFERERDTGGVSGNGFALSSAPEPGTWVLLGIGATALVGGRRRRAVGRNRSGQPEQLDASH